jgi:hypothetical protein
MGLSKRITGIMLITIGLLRLIFKWDIFVETFTRGVDVNVIPYYQLLWPFGLIALGVYLVIKSTRRTTPPGNENKNQP